jgi:RNA polymerase sigma-70 factor, ECF subfamily
MGVLHIAIPAPGGFHGRRAPVSPARIPSNRRSEATLKRTPEQEAEQQAITQLVRQCIAGDPQAWQQLVVSQHRRIYAICYRFTGSSSDAEDLTQDVFLKLYNNLASFDTLKGSFQTWITTLTRNLLVDHFRRSRLDRASDSLDAPLGTEDDGPSMAERLADPRPSQEHHVAGLELKVKIQAALKQLSPELREAVILRDLEDMDYKEIAQVLHIPEGTVKSRISRGRGELARLLQRIEGQVI